MTPYLTLIPLPEEVFDWRVNYLMHLGVDAALAVKHAEELNPHEVEDLVKKGCAPNFAVRFLLP